MSCSTTAVCTGCCCGNAVPDEVVKVYQSLREFPVAHAKEIRSIIRSNLVTTTYSYTDKSDVRINRRKYAISNEGILEIVKTYLLESTVNVWGSGQQYLIPIVCRDLILNMTREAYNRAETHWKLVYPESKLHFKLSIGDISLGIIYVDIKAFPEVPFYTYDALFEGVDLNPNYRVYDNTPYGSVVNWYVNLDWIKMLSKSVNIMAAEGAPEYEVPLSELLFGWMIYRSLRTGLGEVVLSDNQVQIGDRIVVYNTEYELTNTNGHGDSFTSLHFRKLYNK